MSFSRKEDDKTEMKDESARDSPEQFIEDTISQESIVIFSKTYCPYCTMAKDVFDKLQKPYKTIELDTRDDGAQIQKALGEMTGARTVPRVFVNGECVGGGTDVKSLYDSGKLHKIVNNGNESKK